jgi:acetyltransferase
VSIRNLQPLLQPRSLALIGASGRPDSLGGFAGSSAEYRAEAERIGSVKAIEFADHDAALRMERDLGLSCHADPDDPTLRILRRTFEPTPLGARA